HLLFDARVLVAAVQLVRDLPILRLVLGQIAIEKVELDAPGLRLPYAQCHFAILDADPNANLAAVRIGGRRERQVAKVGFRVACDLIAFRIDRLIEVAAAIEQPDADEFEAEVARDLTVVARENAEAARVDLDALVQPEFGGKIGDEVAGWERRAGALHLTREIRVVA